MRYAEWVKRSVWTWWSKEHAKGTFQFKNFYYVLCRFILLFIISFIVSVILLHTSQEKCSFLGVTLFSDFDISCHSQSISYLYKDFGHLLWVCNCYLYVGALPIADWEVNCRAPCLNIKICYFFEPFRCLFHWTDLFYFYKISF